MSDSKMINLNDTGLIINYIYSYLQDKVPTFNQEYHLNSSYTYDCHQILYNYLRLASLEGSSEEKEVYGNLIQMMNLCPNYYYDEGTQSGINLFDDPSSPSRCFILPISKLDTQVSRYIQVLVPDSIQVIYRFTNQISEYALLTDPNHLVPTGQWSSPTNYTTPIEIDASDGYNYLIIGIPRESQWKDKLIEQILVVPSSDMGIDNESDTISEFYGVSETIYNKNNLTWSEIDDYSVECSYVTVPRTNGVSVTYSGITSFNYILLDTIVSAYDTNHTQIFEDYLCTNGVVSQSISLPSGTVYIKFSMRIPDTSEGVNILDATSGFKSVIPGTNANPWMIHSELVSYLMGRWITPISNADDIWYLQKVLYSLEIPSATREGSLYYIQDPGIWDEDMTSILKLRSSDLFNFGYYTVSAESEMNKLASEQGKELYFYGR